MAYSVVFSGPGEPWEPLYLAPIGAWTTFQEWARKLPRPFEKLREFAAKGKAQDTLQLGVELIEAARSQAEDRSGVAAALTELIGVGDSAETITLVD